jgi:hypothetical protein
MSPVGGLTSSQEAEDELTIQLQAAATANGNGSNGDLTGYGGSAAIEILQTSTGSATLTLQGSYDGVNWYAVGYMQVDNVTNPVRSVAALAVTASPFAHVYQLLDTYNLYRAVISATAGSLALTATLRGLPI